MVIIPAKKMKKADIIKELKDVYGIEATLRARKSTLVELLEEKRELECNVDDCCGQLGNCDLSTRTMSDEKAYKTFWDMFKFWK